MPIWKIDGELFWTIIVLLFILCLLGCSSLDTLSNEEIVGVVATEVAEAAPIVANSPNLPGILTAIVSVVAGIAGAGAGAAGQKVAIKKKIAKGALGKHASESVDSL